ncbi:hypothetical protein [Chitinolyticbacter meiyuanensis]|uniref:hypothetical protein n=1 Tax=Chitinolyticbacter meiyuanensis TaxID=682798 RepID=UPI0011E5964D|nr:hypothetical protein [Chitinolyticbacter meiyuanensis]
MTEQIEAYVKLDGIICNLEAVHELWRDRNEDPVLRNYRRGYQRTAARSSRIPSTTKFYIVVKILRRVGQPEQKYDAPPGPSNLCRMWPRKKNPLQLEQAIGECQEHAVVVQLSDLLVRGQQPFPQLPVESKNWRPCNRSKDGLDRFRTYRCIDHIVQDIFDAADNIATDPLCLGGAYLSGSGNGISRTVR